MTHKQAASCFFGLASFLVLETAAIALLLIERTALIIKTGLTQPTSKTPETLALVQMVHSLQEALNLLFGLHVLTCAGLLYVSFLLLRQFRKRTTT